jgi:hypothetical protein
MSTPTALALASAAPAPAGSVDSPSSTATNDADVKTVPLSTPPITLPVLDFNRRAFPNNDANEIIPGVFLGNIRAAHNRDQLLQHGITHIVCCIRDSEPRFPNEFEYESLQLYNELDSDKVVEYFPKVNAFINRALAGNGAVLIRTYMNTQFRLSSILFMLFVPVDQYNYRLYARCES